MAGASPRRIINGRLIFEGVNMKDAFDLSSLRIRHPLLQTTSPLKATNFCRELTSKLEHRTGARQHDAAVRDERTTGLQADALGTIDASLPAAESGTRLRTAAALEGAGDQTHALRLSPADRNLGERRASGKSQTSVSAVERLAMRIRQRRRIRWNGTKARPGASRPNERWSIDFLSDCVSGPSDSNVDHGG
jgi:hypothetical protein